MKKITFLFLMFSVLSVTEIFSQTDYYTCIPSDGSTSGNARAPHGRFRYQRGVILIKPTEMASSGLSNGDVINSIAFNYLVAQDVATSGTMTLYLENTADVANNKSTTWATAITGMTTVSTGAVTIPNTAGNVIFSFSGGSPFTYTGGGVYVAFDYQNAANPLPTTFVTVDCNSTGLTGGYKGGQSDTAIPTTITASNFRPVILLGKQVSCSRPTNLSASTPTLTSSILSFVSSGGTTDIEYGPYGYIQGSGTSIANVTSPYTLNGLNSSSVYDFYVRKNCGTGNSSAWNGPYSFNTVFTSVDPTYTESFEAEVLPFVGWVAVPNNTADAWFINGGLAQDGANTTASVAPVAAAADSRMFSRGVNLIAGSDVNVTYYVRNYVATSTNTANYELTVGTAQTAASQTIVVGGETGVSTTTYVQKSYNFTAPSTGTFYFAFHNTSPANATGTQALLIDNFVVTQTLSNSQFSSSNLNVYPNPATNVINFSNDVNALINSVEMTDMNGRIVKSVKVNAAQGQISIGELATGVYMIKINTDRGTATKKVVKQ